MKATNKKRPIIDFSYELQKQQHEEVKLLNELGMLFCHLGAEPTLGGIAVDARTGRRIIIFEKDNWKYHIYFYGLKLDEIKSWYVEPKKNKKSKQP